MAAGRASPTRTNVMLMPSALADEHIRKPRAEVKGTGTLGEPKSGTTPVAQCFWSAVPEQAFEEDHGESNIPREATASIE